MKNINALFFICLYISIFTNCASTYFKTANKMSGITGEITTNNGEIIEGKLTADINSNKIDNNYIELLPINSKKTQNIPMKTIKSIAIRNNTYYPKIVGTNLLNKDIYRFVKLISPSESRIKLYEYETITTTTITNSANVTSNIEESSKDYFVEFPDMPQYECIEAESRKFTPDFDEKVPKLLKNCPKLIAKIKDKDKEYYYHTLSDDARTINVWLNIINEYEKCK